MKEETREATLDLDTAAVARHTFDDGLRIYFELLGDKRNWRGKRIRVTIEDIDD